MLPGRMANVIGLIHAGGENVHAIGIQLEDTIR